MLHFNGRQFTSTGKAKRFVTMLDAYRRGERMLREHPVLRSYRLYVKASPS